MVKIRITGSTDFFNMSKEDPDNVIPKIISAMNEIGSKITEETVKNIVKNKTTNTGKLSQSIKHTGLGKLSQKVEVTAKYGMYVEGGTRPHTPPLRPLQAYAQRKFGNKKIGFLIQRKIKRKGTKAKPFFQPAIDQTARKVEGILEKIFK